VISAWRARSATRRGHAAGRQVRRRRVEPESHTAHPAGDQIGLARTEEPQGDVGLTAGEIDGRVVDHQLQAQARPGLHQLLQPVRQPLHADARLPHRQVMTTHAIATATDPLRRTRTHSYQLPRPPSPELMALPGLEAMRMIVQGHLGAPSICDTLDFSLTHVEAGMAVFEGRTASWMYNPLGTVHGGWMATLLDSALGCAVHTTLPAGSAYTTASLEVKFVRPVTAATGLVRATARVVHAGRKLATAEARLVAVDGDQLLAHATTTCIVLPLTAPGGAGRP
jgi:uncharacterized protein (TIGR00369 family)